MDQKIQKQQQLNQLYAPYIKCTMCPLANLGRSKVVFGEGNPDSRLMFIGEGPGADEDAQGRPFVGRSGKLLNKIFDLLDLKREDIFISNIVKCRPPGNRKPLPLESKTCKGILLLEQIRIIKPTIICTLGASSLEGLIESKVQITKIHGQPISWKDTTIIPAYHPAYILRNPKELDALVKDITLAYTMAYETEII